MKAIENYKKANQADPTLLMIMRRNKEKHGVGYGRQSVHLLNVLWLIPIFIVVGKVGEITHIGKAAHNLGDLMLFGVWLAAFFGLFWWWNRETERTDPIEQAKRAARPQLMPATKYRVIETDHGFKIVDPAGNVVG